jgi:hypothetical protein
MNRLLPLAFSAVIAAGLAACGSGAPNVTPGPTPVATPGPTPVAVPGPTPVAVPGQTPLASTPGDGAPATITLGNFGEADGPGESVGDAVARGAERPLVNGILLKDVNGSVWLCDALLNSSPPDCAEPRLLVVNLTEEDQIFVVERHHEMDGVRWVDRVQLYGDVRP